MKIIEYGLNTRLWFQKFEKKFYSRLAPGLKPKYKSSREYLGKSFSFFIFENLGIRNLCMFDVDDGCGYSIDHCKINYNFLDKLMSENDVNDYVIFKAQLNVNPAYSEYYKDLNKTIPLGYFPEEIDKIFNIKMKMRRKSIFRKKERKKDIDIFWIGSVINDMGENMIWPKNKCLKYWSYGKRIAGFKALQKISERRNDLEIICSDKKVPPKNYFKMISRSKICFDLPGVGEFTKRFIELLILEKCVISFKKLQKMQFNLKEGIHYIPIDLDDDIEYKYITSPSKYPNAHIIKNLSITPKQSLINKISKSIENSLNNLELIEDIEKNLLEIQKFFTPDYIIRYIKEKALNYFFSN
jgi:hypothetical protein